MNPTQFQSGDILVRYSSSGEVYEPRLRVTSVDRENGVVSFEPVLYAWYQRLWLRLRGRIDRWLDV